MIKRRKLKKNLIIISLIIITILIVIQIEGTFARYKRTAIATREVDIAIWIVENSFQSQEIILDEIYPSANSFEYTFTVSNFNDTKTAETDLSYEIVLTATTNMPLGYEIMLNNTACTMQETLFTDSYGTVYRRITLSSTDNNFYMVHETPKTDTFKIKVTFPEEYNENYEYADLIENIKLELTARQVID